MTIAESLEQTVALSSEAGTMLGQYRDTLRTVYMWPHAIGLLKQKTVNQEQWKTQNMS